MVDRVLFRDRKHPVDRVIINDFNRKIGGLKIYRIWNRTKYGKGVSDRFKGN